MEKSSRNWDLDKQARERWETLLDDAIKRIGPSQKVAAYKIQRQANVSAPQTATSNFEPELSVFKKGKEDNLRRWFEGTRRRYLEAFADLLGEPPEIFDRWLEMAQRGSPTDTHKRWHRAFPGVATEAVEIPALLLFEGKQFTPDQLARRLVFPSGNSPFPGDGGVVIGRRSAGEPDDLKGSIILHGAPGSGAHTAARQLKAALERCWEEKVKGSGDSTPAAKVTFSIHDGKDSAESTTGLGVISISRPEPDEMLSWEPPDSLEPRLHLGLWRPHPPESRVVEMAPWGSDQVNQLLAHLLVLDHLASGAKKYLGDFRERVATNPDLLGNARRPDQIISLLGEVAGGSDPSRIIKTSEQLSAAAWKVAERQDTSGALAAYGSVLVERLWSEWLLSQSTPEVYAQQYQDSSWAFIPDAQIRQHLEQAMRGQPGPVDPSGARRTDLADLETAKGDSRKRILERLRQALIAPQGDALLHGLTLGGVLRKPDHRVEDWIAADLELSRIWAARGLSSRPKGWLRSSWERLLDRRWHPILKELAKAGSLSWRQLRDELEGCPAWALVDRARWLVLFAADHPDPVPKAELEPVWATTLYAVVSGAFTPWLGPGDGPDLSLEFRNECEALRRLSVRYQSELPDLTDVGPADLIPWLPRDGERGQAESQPHSGYPSLTMMFGDWDRAEVAGPTRSGEARESTQSLGAGNLHKPTLFKREPEPRLSSLERLEQLVPAHVRAHIRKWRPLPIRADVAEDEPRFTLDALPGDEHGFQTWPSVYLAQTQLMWLAPQQCLPLDLTYPTAEDVNCYRDQFPVPRFPTREEVGRRLDRAAERGDNRARWVLAGGLIASIPRRRERWIRAWERLAVEIRIKWLHVLKPTSQELVASAFRIEQHIREGEYSQSTQNVTHTTSSSSTVSMPGRVPGREAPAPSRAEVLRAQLQTGLTPEHCRVLELYAGISPDVAEQRLVQPRSRGWGCGWDPFESDGFCLQLAERTGQQKWLRDLAQSVDRCLAPESLCLTPMVGRTGVDINVKSDLFQFLCPLGGDFYTRPFAKLLPILEDQDVLAEAAAEALYRLGDVEPLRLRWHRRTASSPSASLLTGLQDIQLLRTLMWFPPPLTPHLTRLSQRGLIDAACDTQGWNKIDRERSKTLLKGLVCWMEKMRPTRLDLPELQFHPLTPQRMPPLTPEDIRYLEEASPQLQMMAEQLWQDHQPMCKALGWFGPQHAAESLAQAPRLMVPPFESYVTPEGSQDRSSTPWVNIDLVGQNISIITRQLHMETRIVDELEQVLHLLHAEETTPLPTDLIRWLKVILSQAEQAWESDSPALDSVLRARRERAIVFLLRHNDSALLRDWLEAIKTGPVEEQHPEQPGQGPIHPDDMKIMMRELSSRPEILDALWSLPNLDFDARLKLVNYNITTGLSASGSTRPWVFDFLQEVPEGLWLRKLAIKLSSDPRVTTTLRRILKSCPPGRSRVGWTLALHKHEPYCQEVVSALKHWSLEDDIPLYGGEDWSWSLFGGVLREGEPLSCSISHKSDGGRRLRLGWSAEVVGHSEEEIDALPGYRCEELLSCFAGWCQHVMSSFEYEPERGWTRAGAERLLKLRLASPLVFVPKGSRYEHSAWTDLSYLELSGSDIPQGLSRFLDPVITLGAFDIVQAVLNDPPKPMPGDDEVFAYWQSVEGEMARKDRPTMIQGWLEEWKKHHRYEPGLLRDEADGKARQTYQTSRSECPDQPAALLLVEVKLLESGLNDEQLLNNFIDSAKLLAEDKISLEEPCFIDECFRVVPRTQWTESPGLGITPTTLQDNLPNILWLLWALHPQLAIQIECRLAKVDPGYLRRRVGNLHYVRIVNRWWSPSLERLLREQSLPLSECPE